MGGSEAPWYPYCRIVGGRPDPEQNLLALVGGSNCAFCKDGMDKWHDLCGKISIRKVESMQASFQEAEQHYQASRFSEMIKCLQLEGRPHMQLSCLRPLPTSSKHSVDAQILQIWDLVPGGDA